MLYICVLKITAFCWGLNDASGDSNDIMGDKISSTCDDEDGDVCSTCVSTDHC